MRGQALTHPAESSDSSRDSREVLGSGDLAVKEVTSHTPARIAESSYADGNILSRLVYRSSYMLSFGVVYPVMMVVHVVPRNNAIVHGLVDGALAAREQVAGWSSETGPEPIAEELAHESGISGNGASPDRKPRRQGTRRRAGSASTPKRSSRKR
jgi:hypothetical protein